MCPNNNKISVLMPCFNAAQYISEAISSVLAQTYDNFEFLIVDDGSTDNTEEIVKSFNDERILLIRQERQGIAAALNLGLQRASAPFIARFDADDVCYSHRLQTQLDFMMSNADCLVVGSAADYIDENGNYIFTHYPLAETSEQIQRLPIKVCPFIHASVMYRREGIMPIKYNLNAYSFEDHLLWLQLKRHGKMFNMREPLLRVRINPGSYTIDEKKRSRDFRRIKFKALEEQHISKEDGNRLKEIIDMQNNPTEKQGAYHSLLAKKFLWNNYDPPMARLNMKKAIRLNPFDVRDYLLYMLSYLPKKIILHIYSILFTVK